MEKDKRRGEKRREMNKFTSWETRNLKQKFSRAMFHLICAQTGKAANSIAGSDSDAYIVDAEGPSGPSCPYGWEHWTTCTPIAVVRKVCA